MCHLFALKVNKEYYNFGVAFLYKCNFKITQVALDSVTQFVRICPSSQ